MRVFALVRLDPAFSRVWNESGVFFEIAGRFVVLRVGDFPGMEGDEEEGMHEEAHYVV